MRGGNIDVGRNDTALATQGVILALVALNVPFAATEIVLVQTIETRILQLMGVAYWAVAWTLARSAAHLAGGWRALLEHLRRFSASPQAVPAGFLTLRIAQVTLLTSIGILLLNTAFLAEWAIAGAAPQAEWAAILERHFVVGEVAQ